MGEEDKGPSAMAMPSAPVSGSPPAGQRLEGGAQRAHSAATAEFQTVPISDRGGLAGAEGPARPGSATSRNIKRTAEAGSTSQCLAVSPSPSSAPSLAEPWDPGPGALKFDSGDAEYRRCEPRPAPREAARQFARSLEF